MIEFTYLKGMPIQARGGPVRVALHASGVQWKDTSLTYAELAREKAEGKYPVGLPVMKLASGKEVTQSVAMARYAGKLGSSGLYPSDVEDALIVDVVMDTCQDALTKCPQEADETIKKMKREQYAAGRLKVYMDDLSAAVKAKGGPFVLGAKLTLADLAIKYFLYDMIAAGLFDYVASDYVKQWPDLVAHSEAVDNSDIVKAYKASLD